MEWLAGFSLWCSCLVRRWVAQGNLRHGGSRCGGPKARGGNERSTTVAQSRRRSKASKRRRDAVEGGRSRRREIAAHWAIGLREKPSRSPMRARHVGRSRVQTRGWRDPAAPMPPRAQRRRHPADPNAADAPGIFGSTLVGLGSPAQNAPGGLAGAAAVPSHPLELSSYFILQGQWVQQDPKAIYIVTGRNNGFSLGDARVEITGRPADNLWLFLSLDGSVANRSATDPSQGQPQRPP